MLGEAVPPDLINDAVDGDARLVLERLHRLASARLTERFFGPDRVADTMLLIPMIYADDPRLGLWYWFLDGVLQEENTADAANVRVELLVALYYLTTAEPQST